MLLFNGQLFLQMQALQLKGLLFAFEINTPLVSLDLLIDAVVGFCGFLELVT